MLHGKLGKQMALGACAVVLAAGIVAVIATGCASGPTGTQATGTQAASATTLSGSSGAQTSLVDTITVSGTGTVSTLPDEAVIQIAVESSATTAAAALDENSKQTQKVLARLKADGVPDSAIETTNVAVYPNRNYDPKTGQGTVTSYQATNSVNVTLTDFKLIGQVFAAAAEAGANNMSGPTWQLSENSQAETEALNKAATNARSKADALAAAEGVAVGQVLILDETSASPISPVYNQSTAGGAASPSVSPPPVNPQNIDVTASVSVTYQIKR